MVGHWLILSVSPVNWIFCCNGVYTVYPKKCAHGFVVLCFVVVMQSFIMNSHEVFIHIHQGCFAGTGAIVRLPQCQWSKPDGYGKIRQCITTTKHCKAKTVCIFLGIHCSMAAPFMLRLCFNMSCGQVVTDFPNIYTYAYCCCFNRDLLNHYCSYVLGDIFCVVYRKCLLVLYLYFNWRCIPLFCIYIYVYIYVCVCVCVRIYVYMYMVEWM